MYTLLGGADTVFFPLQRDDAPGLPNFAISHIYEKINLWNICIFCKTNLWNSEKSCTFAAKSRLKKV